MSVSRREFLQAGAVAIAGANVATHTQSGGRTDASPASVKALVFDTFGTVVDWRTSVAGEVHELARRKGVTMDAAKFADAWRAGREVYQSAADILDLKTGDVMMVAAHLGDLRAAKSVGLKTAFVTRPLEYGPDGKPDLKADASADVSARDFNDLAGQLGA